MSDQNSEKPVVLVDQGTVARLRVRTRLRGGDNMPRPMPTSLPPTDDPPPKTLTPKPT